MADCVVRLSAPNNVQYDQPIGLFINNEFVPSISGQRFRTLNPSDETEITSVFAAEHGDIDLAVSSARRALKHPSWKALSGSDRGALLSKLADLIEKHRQTLATIETWDNGKPYWMSYEEDLSEVIKCIRYYAGWADKVHGQTVATIPGKFAYTVRQPIGVVGQIIPWNFPLSMASWKLGPALACGNTVVMKPAEQTPLSILYLATLIKEAGFPPGVVNILNGEGRVAGSALVQHPGVDKVAFTGSTVTGREIMKLAAGTLKNITLETGGKSPLLVFHDANLEQAAKWAHIGVMYNQGQVCTSTSRLLVHESVYEKFVELFKEVVDTTSTVGDPFSEGVFQGPQISETQYKRVLSYVESGKSDGAKLLFGGGRSTSPLHTTGKGYFVAPTIFTDVKDSMRIATEEIFGPLVAISRFSTEEEAIERANNSMYGLGASVFTRDIERAHRVASEIEAGMVWVNSSNDSDIHVPFGGIKQSGVGRELGEAGLEAYSQIKTVYINMGTNL